MTPQTTVNLMNIFNKYILRGTQPDDNRLHLTAYAFVLAVVMALLKISFLPANATGTALWEETSIYLHAVNLPFGSFLFYPDCGYINFLPKLAAFLTLRVFGLVSIYPLAFTFFCFLLSALSLQVFLSHRFSVLIPSAPARFMVCLLLFFFPDHDYFHSYNASYYVVFILAYYVICMSDSQKLQRNDCLFIFLTAPAAAWAKPILFPFGLAIFYIGIKYCLNILLKKHPLDKLKLVSFLWILALFAIQLFFTLLFYPNLGVSDSAHLAQFGNAWAHAFFILKQFIIFLGYGVGMPLNVAHSAKFGFFLYSGLGFCIIGITVLNVRFCLQKSIAICLLLHATLLICCFLSVYGLLQSQWLYICTFTDSLFQRPWDHRQLFSFIVFSNVQLLFFLGRSVLLEKTNFLVVCYSSLIIASLCIIHPMVQMPSFTYSLTWSEAKKLLKDPFGAIPIPQLTSEMVPPHETPLLRPHPSKYDSNIAGLFYSPFCNWGSGVVNAHMSIDGTPEQGLFGYQHSFPHPDRKVKYLLVFPKNNEHVFLPKGTELLIKYEGLNLKATLVNPGTRGYYLFSFDRLVNAKATTEFILKAPYGYPPQLPFTILLIGFWG